MPKTRYNLTEQDRAAAQDAAHGITASAKPRASYARWLSERMAARAFPPAKLDEATALLALFHASRAEIAHPARDIFHHLDLVSLESALRPFDAVGDSHPAFLDAANIAQRAKDTRVLYKSRNLKVFMPLSQEAAIRTGRGTKWCVAAETSSNYFWEYAAINPLVFVSHTYRDKRGKARCAKFAIAVNEPQWVNAADKDITPAHLLKQFPILAELLRPLARPDIFVRSMPKQYLTYNDYLAAVGIDGSLLSSVPVAMRDDTLCARAVHNCGEAFASVPKKIVRTPLGKALSRLGVAADGKIIHGLPAPYRDKAAHRAALRTYPELFNEIPIPAWKDRGMYAAALEARAIALWQVPAEFRDKPMLFTAARSGANNVKHMRPQEIDDHIIESASKAKDADYLLRSLYFKEACNGGKELPQHIVMNILTRVPEAVSLLPLARLTPSFCAQAILCNQDVYTNMPAEAKTPRLKKLAMRAFPIHLVNFVNQEGYQASRGDLFSLLLKTPGQIRRMPQYINVVTEPRFLRRLIKFRLAQHRRGGDESAFLSWASHLIHFVNHTIDDLRAEGRPQPTVDWLSLVKEAGVRLNGNGYAYLSQHIAPEEKPARGNTPLPPHTGKAMPSA